MNIKPEIATRIDKLEKKYKNSGQDLSAYLDGLLHNRYLTYWDYIHLDTLLSLQTPRTHFPDEEIFIVYHQITELYFKLVIHEQKQIVENKNITVPFFVEKINRINRYFKTLTASFEIMTNGMEKEQFLRYRMSLLPASGFQSVQYRMIEIYATPLEHLVHSNIRNEKSMRYDDLEYLYENSYWKQGGINEATGEKTLTLKQFEQRYTPRFMRIAREVKHSNIWKKYLRLSPLEQADKNLTNALKQMDVTINIHWSLMHLGSAIRYLKSKKSETAATGGTNWKQFLPPQFQKIIFFPDLWSFEEKENWGRHRVEMVLNGQK